MRIYIILENIIIK